MDKDFVDRHKLSFVTKRHHIPVEVINGKPLISGDVNHETIPLDIILEGCQSIIAFSVIKSSSNSVIKQTGNIRRTDKNEDEDDGCWVVRDLDAL